jgi:hypothetical protein
MKVRDRRGGTESGGANAEPLHCSIEDGAKVAWAGAIQVGTARRFSPVSAPERISEACHMSAQVSIFKGTVLAMAAALAIAVAGNAVAGPGGGGHAAGGGFHGGGGYARGGWGGHGYSGWRGGWRGYGGWRGGWAGWRYGCCGWGWAWPWVGLGWYVPALPLGYTTVWWDGVPYYYANNYYYAWDGNVGQYAAVQAPQETSGVVTTSPSPAQNYATGNGNWTDLFAYPKGGQSPEQQTRDREECRTWAVTQTGFDPSKPTSDNLRDWEAKRDGYLRAEGACLQARNYTVR